MLNFIMGLVMGVPLTICIVVIIVCFDDWKRSRREYPTKDEWKVM